MYEVAYHVECVEDVGLLRVRVVVAPDAAFSCAFDGGIDDE